MALPEHLQALDKHLERAINPNAGVRQSIAYISIGGKLVFIPEDESGQIIIYSLVRDN